jgi:hypothetical protein
MSNDFIDQLTLNILINKNQLNKLNKIQETNKVCEKDEYKERIITLFNELMNDNKYTDLSQDVLTGFNYFIEKSIYYFKIHDKHKENSEENGSMIYNSEEDDKNSTFSEDKSTFSEENSDVGNETEDEESHNIINKQFELITSLEDMNQKNVSEKVKKNSFVSCGVDDISKLNYNWFETAKQRSKQNKIIPRTNEKK